MTAVAPVEIDTGALALAALATLAASRARRPAADHLHPVSPIRLAGHLHCGANESRSRVAGRDCRAAAANVSASTLVESKGTFATLLVLGVGITHASGPLIGAAVDGIDSMDRTGVMPVAGVLLLVAMAACLVPAWRASRLDPLRTMQE